MMKRFFKRLAYIRELEAEIITLRRALDNASNYATLLETVKKDKENQIAHLKDDVVALGKDVAALSSEIAARRLCYGKDKETLIAENVALHKENEVLQARLNGRLPS